MEKYRYYDLLQETYKGLKSRGLEPSRADWLLEDLSGMTRTELLVKSSEIVPDTFLNVFLEARDSMYKGVPVQYIVGFAEFYGRKFNVNHNVLIPRVETEELVYRVLQHNYTKNMTACDIGTGSGAIAITLKKEVPQLNVIATDISVDAIEVAQRNAQRLHADINFMQGDTLRPIINAGIKLDLLVSNPPYIDLKEQKDMSDTVLKYEPHLALFAKEKGYEIYHRILKDLEKVMNIGGKIIFEIGYLQGEHLKNLILSKKGTTGVKIIKDINEKDRMIEFVWEGR